MHIKLSLGIAMIDTAFFYFPTVEDHLIYDETMPQPALILRHSCAGIWIVRSGPTGNRERQTLVNALTLSVLNTSRLAQAADEGSASGNPRRQQNRSA